MIHACVCCLCSVLSHYFTSFWPAVKCICCSAEPWTSGRWLNSNPENRITLLETNFVNTCRRTIWPQRKLCIPDDPAGLQPSGRLKVRQVALCSDVFKPHPFHDPLHREMLFYMRCGFLLCRCSVNTMRVSSLCEWQGWQRERGRRGRQQCEPIYTSREEPERCWGHAEPSTAGSRRHHVKHAHLTFNQRIEIPGLRRGLRK